MVVLATVPALYRDGAFVAALRSVPIQATHIRLARCGECGRAPDQPEARCCTSNDCPIRHHAGSNAR